MSNTSGHAILSRVNIGLRALMEVLIVIGLGIWGYHVGQRASTRILLAIGLPLAGFGFWGLVDFHQLGRAAEAMRLFQELLISGLVAAAAIKGGAPVVGTSLAVLSVIHHVLTYALGERLLKGSSDKR